MYMNLNLVVHLQGDSAVLRQLLDDAQAHVLIEHQVVEQCDGRHQQLRSQVSHHFALDHCNVYLGCGAGTNGKG